MKLLMIIAYRRNLVHKTEIEALVTFVLCIVNITLALLLRHGIPLFRTTPVPCDILSFREQKKRDDNDVQCEEYRVATVIQRSSVVAIDIGGNDLAKLHAHIVAGSRK